MQIGKFKLTALEFGRFKLDGGAMFGVIPKVLWQKYHPADEMNRIDMALRCLLIEFENRKILIDTGFGQDRSEKFRKIFEFDGDNDYLEKSLAHIGLTPEDITDVVLTHLHFDHGGGSTIDKNNNPIPAFPNARYFIQKEQLEHARSRFERDKASYLPEDFEPLINAGVVDIVDGEWEMLPGIDFMICNGHTPSMQLARVRDAGTTLLYGADLIPLASQFPLPWIMSYDLEPVKTLEEKRKILTLAAEEKWIFFFEHDPATVIGRVKNTPKGFALDLEDI